MTTAHAPGRLTVVGDHTDYSNGRSLAAAINLGTTVRFDPARAASSLRVVSSAFADHPVLTLPADLIGLAPGSTSALIVGLLTTLPDAGRSYGGTLTVSGDLPIGAGLSSSASLLIATALALGINEPILDLARRCSRAETEAGQDGGLLDQLAILTGLPGALSLLDFADATWRHVPMPEEAELTLVHSGETRRLADSRYAERRAECARAERLLGPLALASVDELDLIDDATIRARAHHVITENSRVDAAARALALGDLAELGALMDESHRSLSQDFSVSTPAIDALVDEIRKRPGAMGARLVGGGFGGCVVVLSEIGSMSPRDFPAAWAVHPSDGARVF